MAERGPLSGGAFQYRDTGSPIHRLPGGIKLALLVALGAAALALRSPLGLGLLVLAIAGGYRLAGLSRSDLWRDARWLCLQGLVVTALYGLRDGVDGLAPGLRTGTQLLVFFLPGALVLRTTPTSQVLDAARAWLPERVAFALATCLRMLPAQAYEAHEIWMAQRLRGARLTPGDLLHPSAWRDWLACVAFPLVVRSIRSADQIALAAEIRGLADPSEETP